MTKEFKEIRRNHKQEIKGRIRSHRKTYYMNLNKDRKKCERNSQICISFHNSNCPNWIGQPEFQKW